MTQTPWPDRRVSEIAARSPNALATGPFGSSIGSRFFQSSGVPVIRGGNLSTDPEVRLIDDNLVFLSSEKAKEFSRSVVHRGDIIFTSWGTINQVGLIDESATYQEYVISNKQMKITPDPSIALPEYLYYQFSGPEKQREILEGSIGTSVPGFNLTRLRSMTVPLPTIEEQEGIVEVLSDADHLIVSLERLILKIRAVKSGMMQELLTGRTRLPGFAREWRRHQTLLSAVTKSSGYWGTAPGKADVDCRIVRAGDVAASHRLKGYAIRGLTTSEAARAALYVGDVLLTASGTIGNVALIDKSGFFASNFIRVLRPRPEIIVGRFLYYALQSSAARNAMNAHLGVSAISNLGNGFYSDPWLDYPPIEEQRAISAVLQDTDAEIAVLERRLEKTRAIKQSMMQQLLTGRVRLPIKEEVSV